MTFHIAFLAFLCLQRAGELVLARRNSARLMALGAREVGGEHYSLIVALHVAWLVGLALLIWDQPVNLWFAALYGVLQLFRIWILASLGERWTTRILVLPGEPLVRRGPYRFLRHPNYVLVACELACAPAIFGLWVFAAVFTVLNGAVLALRISVENRALAEAVQGPDQRESASSMRAQLRVPLR